MSRAGASITSPGGTAALPRQTAATLQRLRQLVRRQGFLWRLIGLGILTASPFLAVILLGCIDAYHEAMAQARQRVATLAQLAAAQQDALVVQVNQTLNVLQALPAVSAATQDCPGILRQTMTYHPEFATIAVVAADGTIVCHNRLVHLEHFNETEFLHAALAADAPAFRISQVLTAPSLQAPVVLVARALRSDTRNDEGPAKGIILASLRLQWFADQVQAGAGTAGLRINVIDARDGTVLARRPDTDGLTGRRVGDHPVIAAIRGHPQGGAGLMPSLTGEPVVAGYAPLTHVGAAGPFVMVSLPLSDIQSATRRVWAEYLAASAVALVLSAIAAWVSVRNALLQPLRSITTVAQRLAAGELSARVSRIGRYGLEVRDLARTLNHMAARLQNDAATTALALARAERGEAAYRELAEKTGDIIIRFNLDFTRRYVSPACRAILGYEPEELIGEAAGLIHPDDAAVQRKAFEQLVAGEPEVTATYRLRHRQGHFLWLEAKLQMVWDATTGAALEVIGVLRDVSECRAAEAALRDSEARYRLLAEHSTDLIIQLDKSFVRRFVSPACRTLLGYEPAEMLSMTLHDTVHPDDLAEVVDAHRNITDIDEAVVCRFRYRHKNGGFIWVESIGRRLSDRSGYVLVVRDLTYLIIAEQSLEAANRRLEKLASQDALTGLANRRCFDEKLDREFRRAVRESTALSLVMVDVDHFKRFNDTYGHQAGDACLRSVAAALSGSLHRSSDLAARYGGEEMLALLAGTHAAGARLVAERIRRAVRDLQHTHAASPFGLVTVSAGVATLYPTSDTPDPTILISLADQALYEAKEAGRDRVIAACTNALARCATP